MNNTKTIEVEYVPGDKVVYMGEGNSSFTKGKVYEVTDVNASKNNVIRTYIWDDNGFKRHIDSYDFRPLSDDDVIFKFDGIEYALEREDKNDVKYDKLLDMITHMSQEIAKLKAAVYDE